MNLIILEPHDVGDSGEVHLSGARADHLLRVLRVEPGAHVRVGLLDGPRGEATVQSVATGRILLRCAFDEIIPPLPLVDLLLAVPRPKVMRRLWAQIAALGAGRIMLTNAARVERNYFDTHVLTPACYRPLLVEGLQQASDTRLPTVSIHKQLKPFVEDELDALFPRGLRLIADPFAEGTPRAAVPQHAPERVLLAVGPEGGWNDFERRMLGAHGFHAIGMGPRTLRTDTACIALLTLVHDAVAHLQRRRAITSVRRP